MITSVFFVLAMTAADVTHSYVTGTSPTYILGLDNNLDICLASTQPVTVAELRSKGLAMSDSQRVLLQAFNIIKRVDADKFQCQLPVFREDATAAVRAKADALAVRIADRTEESRAAFVKAIADAGYSQQTYSLIASFVLDRLVWTEFERRGLMASADASAIPSGSKLWSGASWIMRPPSNWKLGTNSSTIGGSDISVTWSPQSLAAINILGRDALEAIVALSEGRRAAVSDAMFKNLTALKLARVPVIAKRDRVYATGATFAAEVAASFGSGFDADAFAKTSGVTDRSKQTLIMWHEVFPAIVTVLESRGLKRPAALNGQSSDLDSVVFIVRVDAK